MKKVQSTDIQILMPTVYWERKLRINYETEFIHYKVLCERKLTKNEIHKLDGQIYLTYGEWEQNMTTALITLNKSELSEYIHFLYGCINYYDVAVNLNSSISLPILVSILFPYLLMLISEIVNIHTVISLIAASVVVVVIMVLLFKKLNKLIIKFKYDLLYRYFYTDLAHIAENHYKQLTEG